MNNQKKDDKQSGIQQTSEKLNRDIPNKKAEFSTGPKENRSSDLDKDSNRQPGMKNPPMAPEGNKDPNEKKLNTTEGRHSGAEFGEKGNKR